MMTIGERIKKMRKAKNLTQQELADKIGTTQNSITRYETDTRTPPNAVISLICREFRVNETWLRTGEGEMFTSADTSILSQLASQYRLTKEQLSLIENFLTLPDKYREAVVQIARHLVNGQEAPETPAAAEPAQTIDEKVAAYRAELEAEEKARERSSASPDTEEKRA